jgi:hypothetical protein
LAGWDLERLREEIQLARERIGMGEREDMKMNPGKDNILIQRACL